MTSSRRFLIVAGFALVIWAMSFGFYYAVWVEHQTLEAIGGHLATGFVQAAQGNMAASASAIDGYTAAKYAYVRQVDAHSHWGGLACILILLGVAFHRVGFDEGKKKMIAVALVTGAVMFPLGVLLQTVNKTPLPSALALLGAALMGIGVAASALGFARGQTSS